MITKLDAYFNTNNNTIGGLKMQNLTNKELLIQLEKQDEGCTIDVNITNPEGEVLYYAYDTWNLFNYGLRVAYLDTDYEDINDLNPNDFNKSDLIAVIRRWLKMKVPSDRLDGYGDEEVKTGVTSIYGVKYSYVISINH